MTELDAKIFAALCEKHGIRRPLPEHTFHPTRNWRFDFCWPEKWVALEVEGMAFGKGKPCVVCGQREMGRHTRGAGFRSDMEKYNEAVKLGWRVLRCLPEKLNTQDTIDLLAEVLSC